MSRSVSSPAHRRFLLLSAAGFLAAGLALYARALTTGFVADDWEFLRLVESSSSIAVCFEPLVGRFIRPLVVLVYYVGYTLFGLWPAPYHLAVVLVHILNAWLLCVLAIRIDREHRRSIGVATGALFLAFAGHSEAVTWVAGMADPLLATFTLGVLHVLDRTLLSERPARWMLFGWVLFAAGMMAKETSVVVPAIAAAFGGARLLWPWSDDAQQGRRQMARRVLIYLSLPVVLVIAYWMARARVFGNPLAAYAGLGTSQGMVAEEVRALVIRTFLPPSTRVLQVWAAGRDLGWLAAAAVLFAAAVWRRSNRGALLCAASALGIALAPALPLTISVDTTETERVVYIPSAFAALITVLVLDSLVTLRALKVAAIAALVMAHGVLLQRMHGRWRDASEVFQGVVQSFIGTVRAQDPGRGGLIFILNMPDNVRGAYVFRRGFHAALHFSAPDLEARSAAIIGVVSQALQQPDDVIEVRRAGPLDFSLDAGQNRFLNDQAPARPFYTFPEWGRSRYRLQFTDAVDRAAVLYVSRGRVHHLAQLTGSGAPFGVVDIPAEGARCDGTIRFSGWALDDREVTRIVLTRERAAIDGSGESPLVIGEGTWAYDTRPDVAAVYHGFPHLDRSEWDYQFPCTTLSALPERRARIHVVAVDAAGQRTDLGARTVQLPR